MMTSSRAGRRQGRRQVLSVIAEPLVVQRAVGGAVAVGQVLAAEVARSRVRQAGERPPGISRLLPLGPWSVGHPAPSAWTDADRGEQGRKPLPDQAGWPGLAGLGR